MHATFRTSSPTDWFTVVLGGVGTLFMVGLLVWLWLRERAHTQTTQRDEVAP